MRCKCGSEMVMSVKKSALGRDMYVFTCGSCAREVTRTTQKAERTRAQFGAGKKVVKWY